jgi:hypothetical protein
LFRFRSACYIDLMGRLADCRDCGEAAAVALELSNRRGKS